MANYFRFYHAQFNPPGLTGQVGGHIGDTELTQSIGELFAPRDSSAVGELNQYRKLFVQQALSGSFDNVQIHLNNVEYPSQISMTPQVFSGDASVSPIQIPTGQTTAIYTGDSDTFISFGSSQSGSIFGFWLRQSLPASVGNDASASFIVQIKGDKL